MAFNNNQKVIQTISFTSGPGLRETPESAGSGGHGPADMVKWSETGRLAPHRPMTASMWQRSNNIETNVCSLFLNYNNDFWAP